MDTFSLSSPINVFEERKRLLAVISCKTTNSVSNITDEKKIVFQLVHLVIGGFLAIYQMELLIN